jgi:hypothetical protein
MRAELESCHAGKNYMRVAYVWEAAYQAALLETDDKKLPSLFQVAKATLDARLNDKPGTPEELQYHRCASRHRRAPERVNKAFWRWQFRQKAVTHDVNLEND